MRFKAAITATLLGVALLLPQSAASGGPNCNKVPTHWKCQPVPTATPNPTPTVAPTATPNPTPTRTPSPTPTATPTIAPTATPTIAPTPSPTPVPTLPPSSNTATMESQAWWALNGFNIPTTVGNHVHVRVTYPTTIVDGIVSFPLRITLHNQVGGTSWLRLHAVTPSGSNIERYREDFVLAGCTDCFRDTSITVNVSGWPTGRHELRFTANVPDEQPTVTGAQRMFQSTGIQLCVRSCTPSYRTGNFLEARGWYDNSPQGKEHFYQNARLTSALSTVRSGGTITVRLGPGADGLTTIGAGVYIDPSFHDGNPGIIVDEWKAAFTGTVELPVLPSGSHRLVLLAHDGQNGGVLQISFIVP